MKKAILGSLAVLPLAAAGVFANAGTANALVFSNGDLLQINADFENTASNPLDLEFVDDSLGSVLPPSLGTFGIGVTSTGFFSSFTNNGATTNPNYQILSADFTPGASSSYLNQTFLKAQKGLDLDGDGIVDVVDKDFTFTITEEIKAGDIFQMGTQNGVFTLSNVKGTFTSGQGGTVGGVGFLSGTFIANEGTFSGTLTVESVPEPATILGLGVVAGSLALSRAGKKNKA
jgi:hypothetical protein